MSEYKGKKQNKTFDDINNCNPTNCFNLSFFRDKVYEELNLKLKEEAIDNSSSLQITSNLINEYHIQYKDYIDNFYNDRTLMIINRIISESSTNIDYIRNNYSLHKILSSVVKNFMLFENELVYFSLYLDKFGWINKEYTLEEYLSLIAFTVKLYLNSNVGPLTSYLKQSDPGFEEKYTSFTATQKIISDSLNILPREVNKKFKELTRPMNIFCRQNYVDLNYLVDEVISMSLPYSETRKDKEKSLIDDISSNSNIKKNKKSKEPPIAVFNQLDPKMKNHQLLIENNPFFNDKDKKLIGNKTKQVKYHTFQHNDFADVDEDETYHEHSKELLEIKESKSQVSVKTNLSRFKENSFTAFNPQNVIKNIMNLHSLDNDLNIISKMNSDLAGKFLYLSI